MQPQRAMPWMARFVAVAMAAIAVGIGLSEAGAPSPRRPGRVGPARHPSALGPRCPASSAGTPQIPPTPSHPTQWPAYWWLAQWGIPNGGVQKQTGTNPPG